MRRISVRAMSTTPASWYADPVKRHELRYWDGGQWTEHVSDDGITGVDPLQRPPSRMDQIDDALTVGREGDPDKIARQLSGTGNRSAEVTAAAFEGGGSLFTEPILVVNQKAKVIELNNQFSVFNAQGERIAIVNEIGQSAAKKVLRLVSSLDQYLTHRLQITDPNGYPLLQLTRPAKVVKSSVIVSDGGSNEIGRIVQRNVFGKIDFGLEAGGQTVGEIKGENWRAWNVFRCRGGPHHEDVRRSGDDAVHDGGQLCRAAPSRHPPASAVARDRRLALGRHRAQAGCARTRLNQPTATTSTSASTGWLLAMQTVPLGAAATTENVARLLAATTPTAAVG